MVLEQELLDIMPVPTDFPCEFNYSFFKDYFLRRSVFQPKHVLLRHMNDPEHKEKHGLQLVDECVKFILETLEGDYIHYKVSVKRLKF